MLGKRESCVHRHSLSWSRDTFCWDRETPGQRLRFSKQRLVVLPWLSPQSHTWVLAANCRTNLLEARPRTSTSFSLPYATSSSTHFGQPNLLDDPLPSSSVTSAHQHPQLHLPNTLLFHERSTLATTFLLPGSGSFSKYSGSVCAHLSIMPSFWGEWASPLTVGENQGADSCLADLGLSLHPVSMTMTSLLPPFFRPSPSGVWTPCPAAPWRCPHWPQ